MATGGRGGSRGGDDERSAHPVGEDAGDRGEETHLATGEVGPAPGPQEREGRPRAGGVA